MAIKPQAQRIECRQCGWTKLYAPTSDALIEAPPRSCEKCHSQDLARTPASMLEGLLSSALALVKNKW